jgi:hypothetical protein
MNSQKFKMLRYSSRRSNVKGKKASHSFRVLQPLVRVHFVNCNRRKFIAHKHSSKLIVYCLKQLERETRRILMRTKR